MPLVPAKCPNCGATLEVDKNKDAAICPYCNGAFVIEKAINNYNVNYQNNTTIHSQNTTVIMDSEKKRLEDEIAFNVRSCIAKEEYKDCSIFDNLKRSIIKYIDLYPSEVFGYAQYFQWVNYGFDFLNEENQYHLVHEVEVFLKSYQYVENAILLDTLITSLKEKIENYYNACERNYENNKLQLSALQEEFTGYLKETEEMKSTLAKNKDRENELSTLVRGMMNESSSLNSKLEKNKYPFGFAIFLIILFFLTFGAMGVSFSFSFAKKFGFDFEALTYLLLGIGSGLICFFSIFFIVKLRLKKVNKIKELEKQIELKKEEIASLEKEDASLEEQFLKKDNQVRECHEHIQRLQKQIESYGVKLSLLKNRVK